MDPPILVPWLVFITVFLQNSFVHVKSIDHSANCGFKWHAPFVVVAVQNAVLYFPVFRNGHRKIEIL